MTTDVIEKAFDGGLEAVDSETLAPAFARMLLEADEIAKGGDTRLGDLLADFKKLVGDTTDTQKVLDVAFNSTEGRRVAREIARILRPDNTSKSATVGARARLTLSPKVRVEKARAGSSWRATWKGEFAERDRQRVLKDLLGNHAAGRAQFWKSSEGRALYDLIHAPGGDLPFDDAVEQLEAISPGWVDTQLAALGGNIAKSDTAIAKIEEKALEIQKASTDMTIEAARAEAWRRNPDLYEHQKRERARARAAR